MATLDTMDLVTFFEALEERSMMLAVNLWRIEQQIVRCRNLGCAGVEEIGRHADRARSILAGWHSVCEYNLRRMGYKAGGSLLPDLERQRTLPLEGDDLPEAA